MNPTTGGGPPSNERARVPGKDSGPIEAVTTTTNAPQNSRPRPRSSRLGQYGSGWCDGFKAGAVDALRQAGRRLPVDAWLVVEQLADEYARAEVA